MLLLENAWGLQRPCKKHTVSIYCGIRESRGAGIKHGGLLTWGMPTTTAPSAIIVVFMVRNARTGVDAAVQLSVMVIPAAGDRVGVLLLLLLLLLLLFVLLLTSSSTPPSPPRPRPST